MWPETQLICLTISNLNCVIVFLQQHFLGTLGGTNVGAASGRILRVAELVLKLLFSLAGKERHPPDQTVKI